MEKEAISWTIPIFDSYRCITRYCSHIYNKIIIFPTNLPCQDTCKIILNIITIFGLRLFFFFDNTTNDSWFSWTLLYRCLKTVVRFIYCTATYEPRWYIPWNIIKGISYYMIYDSYNLYHISYMANMDKIVVNIMSIWTVPIYY